MLYSGTFLRIIVRQGSLSDSSEELFQTSKGGTRYSGVFANYKRQTKDKHLKLMILVLFYGWEDGGVWAH